MADLHACKIVKKECPTIGGLELLRKTYSQRDGTK